jgi:hypothetical protein
VIRSSPVLPGLLAMSFVFYLLYGPIEVALPVQVTSDLHGSAVLLGTFWAVFGVGAVIGELSAPFLRRWPVWPIMTGIVIGWGLAIVPLGLATPLWVGFAAFFAGAVIWGPWMSRRASPRSCSGSLLRRCRSCAAPAISPPRASSSSPLTAAPSGVLHVPWLASGMVREASRLAQRLPRSFVQGAPST